MSLTAWLLHVANTDTGPALRTEFYDLKERLLKKHGRFVGHQIQEIKKPCWGPWGNEYGERQGCLGEKCPHCGGTGVFDLRWVRLERWEWGGFVFHRPAGDTRTIPSPYPPRDMILGRIQHRKYGLGANEARLWLFLLCGEFRLWWRDMRSHAACGWQWWPLTNLQRLTMRLGMWFHRGTCSCGRRYFTSRGGMYACYCRRCERAMQQRAADLYEEVEEVPF